MKNISKFCTAIIFIILLVNAGCSDDPVSPTNENGEKAVATATIGPEGGEIVADEFTLSIPTSSFNTSTEIKVFASTTDKPFGENHVSKLYKIEGLPQDYTKSLKISIKHSNVSSSESNLLVIGEEALAHGNLMTGYRFLESIDSSGYTISNIPPYASNQNSLSKITELNDFDHFVTCIHGYGTWDSEDGNFIIYYPINSSVQNAVQLGSHLENAYKTYLDMGFSYEERKYWPIDVILRSFSDSDGKLDGRAYRSKWGDESNWLEFGLDNIVENRRRVTAGHEFFHFVQSLYDSRMFSMRWASIKPNHYWFDEATAAWAEEKFSNSANYSPEVREGNHESPFQGMQKYPSNNPWNKTDDAVMGHGYGLSAVIKYLVSKRGENILIKIYEDLKNGENVVDAIFKTGLEDWWEDFIKEYTLGNVYDDFTLADLARLKDSGGKFIIKSETDKEITFSKNYQDLSGRVFQIRSLYSELNPESQISFKISGASKRYLTLFKYGKFDKEEKIEFVNSSYNEIIIKNFKTLIDNRWNFYAIVSNGKYSKPYTDQHEITLEVKVEESKHDLDLINECTVKLMTLADMHYDYSDGTQNDETTTKILEARFEGSFSGNIFTGSYDYNSPHGIKTKNTITATLNNDHNIISDISWTSVEKYDPVAWGKDSLVQGFSSINVPLFYSSSDNDLLQFRLEGSGVYNMLTKVYYKFYSYQRKETLINYSCDENTYVNIVFKKSQ